MAAQPEPDSLKMFVGQIPKSMNEAELKEMMEEFGPVYQVGIILDKETSQSRGSTFVVLFVAFF
jgi:RNA recognition motif-containing protein